MTRIRIVLLVLSVVFVTGMIAATGASAAVVTLGPEEVETAKGVIEPAEEKEFSIENATGENVKITNILLKPMVKPMMLELIEPLVPECEVKVELAKGGKCNDKVKNIAGTAGGEEKYVIEAEKTHKWKTTITWF